MNKNMGCNYLQKVLKISISGLPYLQQLPETEYKMIIAFVRIFFQPGYYSHFEALKTSH